MPKCPIPRAVRRGFTLAELMVSIAIIVIIALVTVMALGAIMRDAQSVLGRNAVVSSLDNARALAMKSNEPVLAVFRVRWAPPAEQYTEVVLCRYSGFTHAEECSRWPIDRFVPIADAPVRALPPGIKVAGPWYDLPEGSLGIDRPDEVWASQPELALTDPGLGNDAEYPGRLIGIMFAPDGSVITRNPATAVEGYVDWSPDDGVQNIGSTSGGSECWKYDEPDDECNVNVVPFLAVYDDRQAREYRRSAWLTLDDYVGQLVGPEGYINRYSDPIHFNRYSGVAMK